MGDRGPTFLMTCLCVLLAGWLASFLMPAGMLFLAFRPTTRWDLALVWGGVLTAPLNALLVKALLPALARGHVSYVAALVACTCGALVSTAVLMAELSAPQAGAGIAGAYFSPMFGVAGIGGALASTAVAGMFIWGSAQPTASRGGL